MRKAMMLAALGLASMACATHYGGWEDHGRYDPHRIGYDRGYQEGYHHGRADGYHRESYNFRHAPQYRHADNGYRPSYGPRRLYSDGYRRGYERGYRKAFDLARREHRRYRHDGRDDRWDRRPR